ncbi:hypothetical protein TcG_03194 [Trypanosoma cruzi]|uniref:Regulator of chromosome condensation 1-like protein n=1 Tax=Trypanosoma cruzi TaxID=5693 RepID=A0A2V2V903_TRYCR|nr:hypothetical protein BCY84_11771 [Trypanosoma cruzi cruzi]PWU92016.1 regulator of chromosome condensation 1-like protein [Trypanosoma cruzi]RNF21201.1 hypothetical protein TcG_03194 [Trypanosoma cruzi]
MFFWGSYNFQTPNLVEHEERPALRYPLYVPPTLAMVGDGGSHVHNVYEAGDADGERLRLIDARRIVGKLLACGQRHLVAVLASVERSYDVAAGAAMPSPLVSCAQDNMNWFVYGMGSNHCGQLGHRVPEYTTTLTKLHFEELLSAGSTVTGLACGNKHTIICTSAGTVFAAGDNSFDQLGVTAKVSGFAPVAGLAHITAVYAAGNASFALSNKGQLYSWGEAQYGHLCHGDDGARMDARTLQTVKTNVKIPALVQWFVRHHVVILEVAAARGHVVCRSSDEVYTCGEGSYGKLGLGGLASSFIPQRVRFPERSHSERLCGIAAGDDHTLVLRESSAVGAVVYHFGKMGNGDGQLTPIIIAAPATINRIGAGRGTMSTALTSDGLLYVWGKHSHNKVSKGTNADARRNDPQMVTALSSFFVTDVIIGGTFVVALASFQRGFIEGTQTAPEMNAINDRNNCHRHTWDVVVPQDARVRARDAEVADYTYETAVQAFLAQYLGPKLGPKYVAEMPEAPPLTDHNANAFVRIGAHALTTGQKVRLWMTDVYALGTVVAVLTSPQAESNIDPIAVRNEEEEAGKSNENSPATDVKRETKNSPEAAVEKKYGCRLRIEWQRDDWHEEVITLYSDDETLDTHNPNRWQPLWFLPDPENSGDFLLDR